MNAVFLPPPLATHYEEGEAGFRSFWIWKRIGAFLLSDSQEANSGHATI